MPVLKAFRQRFDPRRYNGASLLGLKGIVVKSHGSADQLAFWHALEKAAEEARQRLPETISARMAAAAAGADSEIEELPTMIHTRISGTGSYLPGEPVSNAADLHARARFLGRMDRRAHRHPQRHLAAPGVASSDLALEAGRRALQAAGCEANDLDLIIVATSTPDFVFPSTAALLQHKLGNPTARRPSTCRRCAADSSMR
jgi:hypothetical protein